MFGEGLRDGHWFVVFFDGVLGVVADGHRDARVEVVAAGADDVELDDGGGVLDCSVWQDDSG